TSGRMHCTTTAYWRAMGLDTPIISYNGASVRFEESGQILFNATLDPDLAREIVAVCAREGLQLNYYLDDQLYTARQTPWSNLYATRTSARFHVVGDLRTLVHRAPTKLLIVASPECVAELYPRFAARYGNRCYVTTSNAEYLEFIPLGADKGRALSLVASHYGIPRERVIAFGDAHNDIPALKWAGLGVAVANAQPEVKAVADRIAPSHDEDGVAVVLEDLFGLHHAAGCAPAGSVSAPLDR
ncbi:MAG: Cof-type HAD-IIB family hydrolase, partial [Armatimonadota bacterium]|nr:Cof-type HAD-IIB family hydrolase [Armatimonadota bacterium]